MMHNVNIKELTEAKLSVLTYHSTSLLRLRIDHQYPMMHDVNIEDRTKEDGLSSLTFSYMMVGCFTPIRLIDARFHGKTSDILINR